MFTHVISVKAKQTLTDMTDKMARKAVVILTLFVLISLSSTLPGGWENVDLNSDDARHAANVAVKEIEKQGNSIFRSVLLKITHAKRQVNLKSKTYFI